MPSSDEEEMQAMRKSKMYQPARGTSYVDDEEDEDPFVPIKKTTSTFQFSAPQKKAAVRHADPVDEDAPTVVDEEDISTEDFRQHFPLSFGKQEEKKETLSQLHSKNVRKAVDHSAELAAPVGPVVVAEAEDDDDDEDPSGGHLPPVERSEDPLASRIPVSHEAVIGGHEKLVSCMALDPSGSRLITGSYDYKLRLYDFAGMSQNLRSFRELEPQEGHQIRSIDYSLTGDTFVLATGTSVAKVYDRDAHYKFECIKGDMYLSDMANTKGHVSALCGAIWHPTNRRLFLTGSSDSTVRIWDAEEAAQWDQIVRISKQKHVIKFKNQRGAKTPVTAFCCNSEGSYIVGACLDGSIQVYNDKVPYVKPIMCMRTAHMEGTETTSVAMSQEQPILASRGDDDTLKLWDLRKFTEPMRVFDGLKTFFPTQTIFSPDQSIVVTGTSVKKNEGSGSLIFVDVSSLQIVRQIGVANTSVVSLLWHKKLNQIFAGCADAKTHAFYDPDFSDKGVMYGVSRKERAPDPMDLIERTPEIHLPFALPMYQKKADASTSKRRREKDAKDPIKTKRPQPPIHGAGFGGRAGSSWTQHLMKDFVKNTDRDVDPREALLKYHELAQADPKFTKAYAETQPEPVFNEDVVEEPEED